jgi:threonine dehydrogenase-like Zn-dependent dehydrogenase
MGPIGFSGLLACCCRNWPVTLYGRDARDSSRVSLATELGSAYTTTLAPDTTNQNDGPGKFDLILECTGNEHVMLKAAKSLAPRGIMVWLGSSRRPRPSECNLGELLRDSLLGNHIFIGSVNSAPRDFHDALSDLEQLSTDCPLVLDQLFTDRVSPADALWHYENRRPHGIKTVVQYDTQTG